MRIRARCEVVRGVCGVVFICGVFCVCGVCIYVHMCLCGDMYGGVCVYVYALSIC